MPIQGRSDALRRVGAAGRGAFLALGLFSLGVNLLTLTVPLYMLQMYDRVLVTRNLDTLLALTLMAAGALLTFAGLDAVRVRIAARLGAWLDRQLAGPVLASSLERARRGGDRSAQGLLDLAAWRGFLTGPGLFPLLDAPWVPLFLLVTFLVHPLLGCVGTVGGALLFAIALLNEVATRRLVQQAGTVGQRSLRRADAALQNADAIHAMGLGRDWLRHWQAGHDLGLALQTAAGARTGTFAAAAKLVRLGLQIGMLGVGAWLVTRREISAGSMVAAAIVLSRALAPIEQAIGGWKSLVSARAARRRLRDLLDTHPAGAPAMPLPRPSGRLAVEAVSYAPAPGAAPILEQVSIALEPGEALGVIGPTAAGKTTLARLLVGALIPTRGQVRLDGADVAVWEAGDRGPHIGYLPQDIELFTGTVRDNIARFREAEADAVVAAATRAGVHSMILRLPKGYETEIGPGGVRLSGGQCQRIALARALFGDPSFVVLDEPNANLDAGGEEALVAAIRELKARGATVVMIAHRPGTLRLMDKILILRDGRVDRIGTRDEVLPAVVPAAVPSRPAPVRMPLRVGSHAVGETETEAS